MLSVIEFEKQTMNYTEDILKILSTELVPYSTVDGQACVDGVLTSAQKLNEFILQLLQQTQCTMQLLPDYCEWRKGVCRRKDISIYEDD